MGFLCVAAHHKSSLERCVMKSLEWHTPHIYIPIHPAARVCQFWCFFWLKNMKLFMTFFFFFWASLQYSSAHDNGAHSLARNTSPKTHSLCPHPLYRDWAASAVNAAIIYETKALVTPWLVSELVYCRCLHCSSRMNTFWCHTDSSHCLAWFSGCHTA